MPAKKSAGARFEPASDQSLLVYFGEQITLEANENVRRLLHLLEQEPIPGVDNLHPAYCSLLVKFAALKWRHQDRKSTRLNSSHGYISYAVFCLKKKKKIKIDNLYVQVPFSAPQLTSHLMSRRLVLFSPVSSVSSSFTLDQY